MRSLRSGHELGRETEVRARIFETFTARWRQRCSPGARGSAEVAGREYLLGSALDALRHSGRRPKPPAEGHECKMAEFPVAQDRGLDELLALRRT